MNQPVRHLFEAISRAEFFSGHENRSLDDTVDGTVAACWYSNLPKETDRELSQSGIRIHFEGDMGAYALGGYPGFRPSDTLPLYMCIYRTEGIKHNNGRSGMSIGSSDIGIAYPDICLRMPNASRIWLDSPVISSIDIKRSNPRLSVIEWV